MDKNEFDLAVEKACKVVNSCVTEEQLDVALIYVDLFKHMWGWPADIYNVLNDCISDKLTEFGYVTSI